MVAMSIYLILALVCGIVLIFMAILGGDFIDMGGDFDIGHVDTGFGDFAHGLSPLSPPLLLAFGASFGAFGTIFESFEMNPILIPIIAGILSTFTSVFIFFMMIKVFIETQATTQVNYSEQVGREAVVTIPISPNQQGQIMLITHARGRTLIPAIANTQIETDSVIVIEKMIGETAEVRKK
jgi:NADH:ubiquinone oxidoreductase subunit 5 (subunit L)/multisubunit Na+/H+ antiporter MnhA subunit